MPISAPSAVSLRPLVPGYAPSQAGFTLSPVDTAALPTDEALMLAWAGGDLPAFQALYERHRRRLHGFLLRQLRDPSLAEEMFQDVWQRVIAARAGWQPDAAFSTWLFRIAHNRLNDHWRAARHRPPAPADADARVEAVVDGHTPETELSGFEQRRRVQQAMDALPPDQREVLLLRLEQELSLEEIAQVTGVGRETVKSRLRYAMDKLRAGLTP
ncbi:MAG: RNA polymerase sigma factor [Stenotrophomonas sp.]|nr:RNA polymerase sigma factor [Stenotrophomonas sp.]